MQSKHAGGTNRRSEQVRAAARQVRVVELYAGTARSWEPFRVWKRASLALLVDNSSTARRVYRANFPRAPYERRDLATTRAATLLSRAGGRVDVVLGCPPCQGFSEAGRRQPADPRNLHLLRFVQLATALGPSVIAMENVPGAASGPAFGEFTAFLERANYRWTAGIFNAAAWGSAQSRQRLLLLAAKRGLPEPMLPRQATHLAGAHLFNYSTGRIEPVEYDAVALLGVTPLTGRLRSALPVAEELLGPAAPRTVADALADLEHLRPRDARELTHVPWRHGAAMLKRMGRVKEGGQWSGASDHYSHSYGRLHRKGLARTITRCFNNPGSGRYWHPTANRALTVREAARLQGYPDSFGFPCDLSKAAALVGNALDASLAKVVFEAVRVLLE